MMAAYFTAEDAQPLPPLGTCARCGKVEEPMLAIFWATTEDGRGLCPECSGVRPSVGYEHWVCLTRSDRPNEMARMFGPYSAAEAERNLAYFSKWGNVERAWILHLPEKGK